MTADPTASPSEPAELAYRLAGRMVDQGAAVAAVLAGTVLGVVMATVLPDLAFFAEILGQLTALGALLILAVLQWFLIASEGTTLGKRLTGIRIVREDGGAVGFVDGVALRTWAPMVLALVTLGLFALLDVLPIFGRDRRCVHDRIARTRVVLDDRDGTGDVAVRQGLAFARRLSVALAMVAFMAGALVLQNVLIGIVWTLAGGLATVVLLGLITGLVSAAAAVYDCRPFGVAAATGIAALTAVFAGVWFAYVLALGGTSVLAWLVASASGYLTAIHALFVGPAGRVSEARAAQEEAAMLGELGMR